MKSHLVFLTICFLLLVTSCNDSKNNEDIKLGASCSVAGMESCSSDSSEILVCKDSLWRTKKSCNINFGEYCRQNLEGSYSCKESDTDSTDHDENDSLPDSIYYQEDDDASDSTDDLENYDDSVSSDSDNDLNNISDDFEDINNDSDNPDNDSVPDNNNSTDDDNISPDNNHEIGETRNANCTGLPANASWNNVSSILQTWNGSEWVPSTAGTYNLTASSSECRYKCAADYRWENSECVSNIKTNVACSGLPTNAVWNSASTITQTWNGSNWIPSTIGSYNTEASTSECRYKCASGYIRENDSCINQRIASCKGLPANAVWNTIATITQTWNGSDWVPSTIGTYNETGSISECRYKCDTDYHWLWENSSCVSNTKTNVACSGIPANAVWNTASSITQTWNGSDWIPSATGSHNTASSSSECRFKCKTHYTWKDSICKADSQVVNCTNLPPHAIWNAVSTISQTWDGLDWTPDKTGIYDETSSTTECRYKCDSGYFWYNSSCVSPCDNNPCLHVTNSTGECTATSSSDYFCKCNTNYHWRGIEEGCTNKLTLGNICTNQKKCYDDSAEMTICPASGENFYGQDAQYAAQGTCTPQSFTVQTISSKNVVIDNNTGLMWQQTMPSEGYSWENAVSYCNNLTYAGYSDWRMPTPKEFLTIFDNSSYNLAVDETYFPNTHSSTTDTSVYWSTAIATDISTSLAWAISFEHGTIFSTTTTNKRGLVRCVRGNNLPNSIFTTSTINDETILTDISTGLIWQNNWVTGKTWEEALDYCEKLTYAGYSDWRMPNKNELASLIDYDKSDPASDLPDLPHNTNSTSTFPFLSSSSYNAQTEGAVCVDFKFGVVQGYVKSLSTLRVRCVR